MGPQLRVLVTQMVGMQPQTQGQVVEAVLPLPELAAMAAQVARVLCSYGIFLLTVQIRDTP